jgi:hypothetical protein
VLKELKIKQGIQKSKPQQLNLPLAFCLHRKNIQLLEEIHGFFPLPAGVNSGKTCQSSAGAPDPDVIANLPKSVLVKKHVRLREDRLYLINRATRTQGHTTIS